jgi:integrase
MLLKRDCNILGNRLYSEAMTTNPLPASANEDNKIIPLERPRLGRIPQTGPAATRRQRFRILEFKNAGGSIAYRVQGMKRDGTYVRQNYADLEMAKNKQVELEAEFLQRQPDAPAIRATTLTDTQIRLAEAIFRLVDADQDALTAIQFWKQHRHQHAAVEAPRLDDAIDQFQNWLVETPTLRKMSKDGLRVRLKIFRNMMRNHRLDQITPDLIEEYIQARKLAPASRDNNKRAISRFFRWCIERPRRWVVANPCREVHVEKGERPPPEILTVDQCRKLLKAAQAHKEGRLAAWTAISLFAGLRPVEITRLTWQQVNLKDGEIRLEANQTKTGRPRVVSICPTLRAWLMRYKDETIFPPNWFYDFGAVRKVAGVVRWPSDVARHTAISHFFRKTGSYGLTAEQFGNSEAIIKAHYQGRVSTAETKAFYALRPTITGLKSSRRKS